MTNTPSATCVTITGKDSLSMCFDRMESNRWVALVGSILLCLGVDGEENRAGG